MSGGMPTTDGGGDGDTSGDGDGDICGDILAQYKIMPHELLQQHQRLQARAGPVHRGAR